MKERIHYVQVCGIGFDERTGRGRNAPLPVLLRISLHSKIEKPLVLIRRREMANFGKAHVGDLLLVLLSFYLRSNMTVLSRIMYLSVCLPLLSFML